MRLDEYEMIVKKHCVKDNKKKNMLIAFISGGALSACSQILFLFFFNILDFNFTDSLTFVTLLLIIIASILTGLCIFDKISSFLKAGVMVPITGFSHAMSSSAMDNKDEGLIFGIGSTMFKLTGSVIVYGVICSVIVAFIRGSIL